jgi:glycolate oxidase
MDLSLMNVIEEIDEENLVAFVGPGVINGEFQREVEKRGLFYPPDPASLKFSTMGGNVAECAGGPRALKYGVTKDYVLGLEVVLPTGEVVRTGTQTIKGVVGYDLTRFLVGSEGTLGVITKIIVKLLPLPESKQTLVSLFPKAVAAGRAVSTIIRSKIIPTTLEFMDQASIRCVEDAMHLGLPRDVESLLLIEVDGYREVVARHAEKIKEVCLGSGAQEVVIAKDEAEAEELWEARRSLSPSLFKLKPTKINEDITVPRSRIAEVIEVLKEIGERHQLTVVSFGHAGDGNIHVNFMIDGNNQEEVRRSEQAIREVFEVTLQLGGTLSGEHGIGTTKAPYLEMELGEMGIEVMRRIKASFDPNNILNPGKIFDVT